MTENYISGNLDVEVFSESSDLSTVKTVQLFSKQFPSSLSFFLYSLFLFSLRWGCFCNSSAKRSLSGICFPHFLSFFFLSFKKKKIHNKQVFFHWNMCFFYFHDGGKLPVSLWSKIISSHIGIRNVPSDVCHDDTEHYQVSSEKQSRCNVCKNNSRRRCINCKVNLHDVCFEILQGY